MADSPTSRTLRYLREQGHLCEVVEKWNHITHTRKDLFDILDLISVKGDKVYGIQATSTGNVMARVTKILENENTPILLEAMEIWVIGFKKYAKPVNRKWWRPSFRQITKECVYTKDSML